MNCCYGNGTSGFKVARGGNRGGAAVVVLLLLAIAFLAGAAYFALQAKHNAEELAKAQDDLASLSKKVEEQAGALSRRPVAVPSPKTPDVSELERAKESEAAGKEITILRQRVVSLERTARENEEKAQSLAAGLEEAKASSRKAGQRFAEVSAELKQTRSEAEETARKLEAATQDLAQSQAALRKSEVQREQLLSQVRAITAKSTEIITSLTRSNEELEARITDLVKALKEYPDQPLDDQTAAAEYQALLGKLEETTDRRERVRLAFKAKQKLAGSRQEARAGSLWAKEARLLQKDIESAGNQAYTDAYSKIRSQRDAHEENVKILEEALEKATGSRREAAIRQLLEKEQQALTEMQAAQAPEPPVEDTPPVEEPVVAPEEGAEQ